MYFLERKIYLINFDLKQFSCGFLIWLVFHQKKTPTKPNESVKKGLFGCFSEVIESIWSVAPEPQGSPD